jgi:iron complex outermembrane recepter protein
MDTYTKLYRLSLLSASIIAANSVSAAQLEEIVVTAQKRTESSQDVPISISAFSGNTIESLGIADTEELALVAPGLNITQSGVGSVVFMRGIGNPDSSGGQEAAVATYIDGAWFGSVTGSVMAMKGIERVEILKGPQGTLFGRNTTGGVINIITKDPSPESAGDITLTVGNYDFTGASFYGTTGISDNLAADLTISVENQGEGYGDNLTTGNEIAGKEDAIFARTKWKYSGDTFDISASYMYEEFSDPRAHNRRMPDGSVSINGETAPDDYHDIYADFEPVAEFENQAFILRVDKEFDNFSLVSITSWKDDWAPQIADNDSSGAWEMNAEIIFGNENISQEFQILSNNDSALSWILGAYFLDQEGFGYYRLDGASMQRIPFFGPGTAGIVEGYAFYSTIETQSFASFGEIGYDITDDTKLTVGIRWTRDEREQTGGFDFWCNDGVDGLDYFGGIPCAQFSIPGVIPPGALPSTVTVQAQDETWSEPTYRLVIDHNLNEDVLLYASYNRGFRSGNYNTVNPGGPPVDPELMDAYEVGMKGDFLNGSLRINAAAYYYEVEDLILQTLQGVTLVSQNAAEAEISGIDMDITYAATENLELFVGFSILDTEYTSYPDASANPPCTAAPQPAGCMFPGMPGGNGATISFDASGNQLLYAPDLSTSVGISYVLPTDHGEYSFSARALHNDEFPFVVDGRISQDAYTLVNLSAGWRDPNDTWGLRLIVKNATNEEYLTYGTAQGGGNGDIAAAADPRTFYLNMDYSF